MEKPQKDELERIAGIYYSQKVSLTIKTNEAPKTNGNGTSGRSAKVNNLNDIKREAMNSPLFQKVLAQFEGAELVDIKPITDKK
jgi:DNA polymerase-3 subunit gamma/tau